MPTAAFASTCPRGEKQKTHRPSTARSNASQTRRRERSAASAPTHITTPSVPAAATTAPLALTTGAALLTPNVLSVKHWSRLRDGLLYAASPRVDWANLLRRSFDVDVLACPKCHGRLLVLSEITEHELGHHVFGHGTRLDELIAEERSTFSPEEYLADCFAAFLLMPKLAMLKAFKTRGIDIKAPRPLDVYRVASFFGVGYTTLLTHLAVTLGVLPRDVAQRLAKASPKAIRSEVVGEERPGVLQLVDFHWDSGRAVDLAVGDAVLLPSGTRVEAPRLAALGVKRPDGELFEAVSPGIGRLEHDDGWSAYVRVERRDYAERALFRNEEECDE